LARAKSVRVELRHADPSVGRVRGDLKRLTQALTSLLVNSIHFAPEDTVVGVCLETTGRSAKLTVHDLGLAVAPLALPYLFDRSRPPDAARTSPRGTFRLGLGFVRDVVNRHGGSITAESAGVEDGMTF